MREIICECDGQLKGFDVRKRESRIQSAKVESCSVVLEVTFHDFRPEQSFVVLLDTNTQISRLAG